MYFCWRSSMHMFNFEVPIYKDSAGMFPFLWDCNLPDDISVRTDIFWVCDIKQWVPAVTWWLTNTVLKAAECQSVHLSLYSFINDDWDFSLLLYDPVLPRCLRNPLSMSSILRGGWSKDFLHNHGIHLPDYIVFNQNITMNVSLLCVTISKLSQLLMCDGQNTDRQVYQSCPWT